MLVVGSVVLWVVTALVSAERQRHDRYNKAGQEAVRFAARMGIVHGGCANESCSGLRDGKPVSYFCEPTGCTFETAGAR